MKEYILTFLRKYADEVYDMPDSSLELLLDDHIVIEWEGVEYFLLENNSMLTEDDNLIFEFLNNCRRV